MTQPYAVPALYQELRPAESVMQLYDALKSLEKVVAQVFNHIEGRVNEERSRIGAVKTRLENAERRVSSIAGTLKATTVYSPAKYPIQDELGFAKPLYTSDGQSTIEWTPLPSLAAHAAHVTPTPEGLVAQQQAVALMETQSRARKAIAVEGLGRLPKQVVSVSNLLLFNSIDNLYRSYVTVDNLHGVEGEARKLAKQTLAPAPKTVTEGDNIRYGILDLTYKPAPGALPQFNMPKVLPGLPGVAELSWSADALQPIAPSHLMANLPVLPSIEPEPISAVPASVTAGTLPSLDAAPPPPGPQPSAQRGGPPPPGPPPPDAAPAQRGGPPPPPPPPPAPPGGDDAAGQASGDDTGRNALLESIRNPGIKLRKVEPGSGAPPGTSDNPAVAPKGKAPDIFSALKAGLMWRRKAMTKDTDGKGADDGDDDAPVAAPKAAPAAKKGPAPPPASDDIAPPPRPGAPPAAKKGPEPAKVPEPPKLPMPVAPPAVKKGPPAPPLSPRSSMTQDTMASEIMSNMKVGSLANILATAPKQPRRDESDGEWD
eukprot:TRINITY_DN1397_c0_g1_i5.p1 TRINITY_DN1397_c0_g1~~TRINITY_DN1397_c0_g1_i5.p1  ORF type:complete len:542 (+),score=147.94 TRINITY_DN1397_c0_g1_i5:48-1673(+)